MRVGCSRTGARVGEGDPLIGRGGRDGAKGGEAEEGLGWRDGGEGEIGGDLFGGIGWLGRGGSATGLRRWSFQEGRRDLLLRSEKLLVVVLQRFLGVLQNLREGLDLLELGLWLEWCYCHLGCRYGS